MLDFSIFTLVEKQSMSLHKDFRCSFHSLWKPLSVCYQNYSRLFLQLDYQQHACQQQKIKNFDNDNSDRIFKLVEKQVHVFLHKDFDVAFTLKTFCLLTSSQNFCSQFLENFHHTSRTSATIFSSVNPPGAERINLSSKRGPVVFYCYVLF